MSAFTDYSQQFVPSLLKSKSLTDQVTRTAFPNCFLATGCTVFGSILKENNIPK